MSDKEKDTSSTSGMETSRLTSPLLQHRASSVVQPRLAEQEAAFLKKDFETFGRLTMQDSNQFHAVCLDTYPPVFYMNDISKAIIRLVHVINAHYQTVKAAYTFDAGPNAVIYTLEKVGWLSDSLFHNDITFSFIVKNHYRVIYIVFDIDANILYTLYTAGCTIGIGRNGSLFPSTICSWSIWLL